jgi:hypothetical protein
MGATGTATINFGATPGTNIASVTVTSQPDIIGTSAVEGWFMGLDSTADHNATEHSMMPLAVVLTPTAIVAGTGFTLTALTQLRLTGQVKVRWVWS